MNKSNIIKIIQTEAYRSGHNEAVLKTVWVQAHGGSNPSASASSELYAPLWKCGMRAVFCFTWMFWCNYSFWKTKTWKLISLKLDKFTKRWTRKRYGTNKIALICYNLQFLFLQKIAFATPFIRMNFTVVLKCDFEWRKGSYFVNNNKP